MGLDAAEVCEALSSLPPEARRRIVGLVLEHGYAVKDVAEIMSVSPSAVSRYIHGSLAPSPTAICRLVLGVDEETRRRILVEAARTLWRLVEALINSASGSEDAYTVLESIADDVARLLDEYSARSV